MVQTSNENLYRELSAFHDFIDNDEEVRRFLTLGLLSSEIFDLFKNSYGEVTNRENIINSLKSNRGLLKTDPNLIAREIGGQNFGLKKGSGAYKRRSVGPKRTYTFGKVYFVSPGTDVCRVYYEMRDSSIPSFSLRLLNAVNQVEPAIIKQIASQISEDYQYKNRSIVVPQIHRWLPRLIRNRYLQKRNGNEYYLSLRAKAAFHLDIEKTWNEFKDWPHRIRFYPQ